MLFFDTSALVRRYADAPGTQTIDRLIETPEDTISIYYYLMQADVLTRMACHNTYFDGGRR